MDAISGIDVQLQTKTQIGTDGFGRPLYSTATVTVSDVLISPVSSEDVINELNLSGKHAVYELAIPKGDTNDWENTKVSFFGTDWRTIGIPTQGIERNIPLKWNKKIKVERYG